MLKVIYLAGGCFWGIQRYFDCVHGVLETQVGYANGTDSEKPTYRQVCTGSTGYVEAVRVVYDTEKISLNGILELYFHVVDPTSKNKQGNDVGTQYRTGVYFVNPEDEPIITQYVQQTQEKYFMPIVTEVIQLDTYYSAEEYHQNYLQKNPSGYCHIGREAFGYAGKYKVQQTG